MLSCHMDIFRNLGKGQKIESCLSTLQSGVKRQESINGFLNACQSGNLLLVKLCMKHGVQEWDQGLEIACFNSNMGVVKLIFGSGCNFF